MNLTIVGWLIAQEVLEVPPQLLGPYAALVLSLVFNILFYTGKILPRNTVPREDYDKAMDVAKTQGDGLTNVTASVKELVMSVRYREGNGGLGGSDVP